MYIYIYADAYVYLNLGPPTAKHETRGGIPESHGPYGGMAPRSVTRCPLLQTQATPKTNICVFAL